MQTTEFPDIEIISLVKSCKVGEALQQIIPHLDESEEARALYCQVLRSRNNIYLTGIQSDNIKEAAEKGDLWMQYLWARYNDCIVPESNSADIAGEYYRKAAEGGIADARMCMAYMWRDGDFGIVDRSRYERERDMAAAGNSHMATQQIIRDITFGNGGFEADPGKALSMLGKFIGDSAGCYIDPKYYTLMGDVTRAAGGQDAAQWYEKGFDEGDLGACLLYAIEACFDEDFNITDREKFEAIMTRGQDLMCAEAFEAVQLVVEQGVYEDYDDDLRKDVTESLKYDLEIGYKLGDTTAAYCLGRNYYYGEFGFEQDFSQASLWLSRGAIRRDASCYELLATMIEDGNYPGGQDPDRQHEYEIRALRLGCDDMLDRVVNAYRHGFLTAYAAEIEQYYLPLVPAEEDEFPSDDDCPDDDGRFDAWV